MNKRIILTGAQGTGKTTILNMFRDQLPVITEVVRSLAKTQNIHINEMGDTESQDIIFDEYKRLLSQEEFISDRGLTDVLAYSIYLCDKQRVDIEHVSKQLKMFDEYVQDNPDVLFFFFPIEFPVEDDGVRSTDEEFRAAVNEYIARLLRERVPADRVYEVHGTPQERYDSICAVLASKCSE